MTFETLKYEVQGATAVITLNRPEVYNALNLRGKLDVIEAVKQAGADTQIRTIILTGEGKAFCSGQDLNDRAIDARKGPVDMAVTLETGWNPLVEAIRNCEKPIIAAINGVSAGAGLSMALACDIKISAPGVKFIAGFAQIGLIPDAGLSYILVRHLGQARALAFALRGKPLLAEEMSTYGLINEVKENPLTAAHEWAHELNNLAPLSLKMTKKNFQAAAESQWSQVLEIEKVAQRTLGFSDDYREGVTAFLEKRKPVFKGQ